MCRNMITVYTYIVAFVGVFHNYIITLHCPVIIADLLYLVM